MRKGRLGQDGKCSRPSGAIVYPRQGNMNPQHNYEPGHHSQDSSQGSLKFEVKKTNGLIKIHVDQYERESAGKRIEIYVKINICCDGKRIVEKKRKCKTRPVKGSTFFKFKEHLNISVEGGFENKQLLVAVWRQHKLVSGILLDIDGASDIPLEFQNLKSKSEIKMAIQNTKTRAEPKTMFHQDVKTETEPTKRSSANNTEDAENTQQQSHRIKHVGAKKPNGLRNLGNTCYANSVLQVLGQTPRFKEELNSGLQNSAAKYLGDVLHYGTEKYIQRLLDIVFKSDNSFRLGKQNDSHSFLLALFSCIQEDSSHPACGLFEGIMLGRFTYSTCRHEEDAEQMFTSLVMPITEQKNLQGCLQEFCKDETFPGNSIPCRICSKEFNRAKDTTETRKRMLFAKLPEILVFQMGRFEERKTSTYTKIQKKITTITFEREIKMYEGSNRSPQQYRLYGVVNHGGSIHGGHYTACVKVFGNTEETWYNCSDSSVIGTSDPSCQPSGAAYLLFYHRAQHERR